MANFVFENATQINFGRGVEERVGALCKKYSLTDTVLITTYDSKALNAYVDKAVDSIEKQGLKAIVFRGVVPNPRLDKTEEAVALARENNVGMTIGIGGGSAMDTAKAVAVGTKLDAPLWDLYTGKVQPKEILPVGVLPTIAASGSETSPFAVLTNTEVVSKIGYGCNEMKPRFALLNPEITFGVPTWQTLCGSFDIFAHVCDAYFGRVNDMKLTYRMSESIMKTVVEYLPVVLKEPDNYEARSQLMLAGTLAMGKYASMGLDTNLGFHTIAEDLGAVYDVTHGAALAVILPAWLTYLKKEKSALLIRYANEVWGIETDPADPEKTIDAGIARTKEFFSGLGLPSSLKELGIDFEKDGKMLAERLNAQGDYGDAYISLTPEIVYSIYEMVK